MEHLFRVVAPKRIAIAVCQFGNLGTHERVFFQLAPGCQKHAFGNLFGIVTECQRAVLDLQIARVRVY